MANCDSSYSIIENRPKSKTVVFPSGQIRLAFLSSFGISFRFVFSDSEEACYVKTYHDDGACLLN